MAARFAWVLNLDADLELAASRFAPKKSVREAMRPFVTRLAESLLAPGDVLVDDASPIRSARGLRGRAFCPTPSAIALLERAGASPEPSPPFDVLRRVNSRAFAASLGQTLPGATFATTYAEALAVLQRAPDIGRDWRIKRAFGMAGRGQRAATPGAIAEADLSLVRASLAEGGVQLEPNLAIEREYAIHGLIAEDGAIQIGNLVVQRCDAYGAWLASEPASPVASAEDLSDMLDELCARLSKEAEHVGDALRLEGYFGPFGVDAFSYRTPDGALAIQPRSEINARYTMGFAASGLPLR